VAVVGRLSVVWAGSGDGWVAGRAWCWRCCADRRTGLAAGGHAGATMVGGVNRRCWGGSAAQRQGTKPGERPGEFEGPWPGVLQVQDDPAGVADDPGGDMPQPVAQRLGSATARSPSSSNAWVQQVRSWAARTSSSQTLLRRHRSKGRLARPVALAARMRSSTRARWRCRNSKVLRSGWAGRWGRPGSGARQGR
jgi:hypothetical protein